MPTTTPPSEARGPALLHNCADRINRQSALYLGRRKAQNAVSGNRQSVVFQAVFTESRSPLMPADLMDAALDFDHPLADQEIDTPLSAWYQLDLALKRNLVSTEMQL